jgi:hypothetical protein
MIWTSYRITWLFLTKLCASVPADPEITKKWLEARQPRVRPAGGRSITEVQEEVFASLADEEQSQQSLLIFQRVDGQLMQRAATVRAHLKDCARVLSAQYIGKIKGERSFATKVINGVYLDELEYWLPILRPEGDAIMKADGQLDKAVHVRGPRGEPLNAIKCFEFVQPARLDFTLKVLGDSVKRADLETLMQYGGVHGYAGERGDGEGKYTFTIDEVE